MLQPSCRDRRLCKGILERAVPAMSFQEQVEGLYQLVRLDQGLPAWNLIDIIASWPESLAVSQESPGKGVWDWLYHGDVHRMVGDLFVDFAALSQSEFHSGASLRIRKTVFGN